jgi:hypothetical protein
VEANGDLHAPTSARKGWGPSVRWMGGLRGLRAFGIF